ncbi:unnamed protein product [Diplocarpon coronariae]
MDYLKVREGIIYLFEAKDIEDQPPAVAAEVLIEFIKHTLDKRKRLYNKYKNNALYFIIDYINLVQFSSFLILYKGIEGLSEALIESYILGLRYLAYRFQSFLPNSRVKITKYCKQYQLYKWAFCRFKISFKDEYEFNYSILINIIYIDRDLVLYIIDFITNYNINRKDNPVDAIIKSTLNKALIEFINTNKIDIQIKG